jgi:hypothetical protein
LWQEESEAMAAAGSIATTASFVQRSGQQLFLDGAPFYVNGWNSYWLMVQSIDDSTRPRMFAVMMAAAALGLTVCRTWAFNDATYQALQISPGNYDENVFQASICLSVFVFLLEISKGATLARISSLSKSLKSLMWLPLPSFDRHKLLKHTSLCHYFNFLKR